MVRIFSDYKPAKLHTGRGDVSKEWYAYFFFRHPQTGKMQQFKKRGQINYIHNKRQRTAAGNLLVQSINELLRDGWNPFPEVQPPVTLIEQLQKECNLKKINLRSRTWQSYEYARKMLTAWLRKNHLEYFKPKEFTRAHAQMFCDYLSLEKKYSGKTFNVMKSFVSVLFNSMADKEMIADNPFRRIKSQRQETGKNIAFTDVQYAKLTSHLKKNNPRLYLITQFIYFCYIRPAELLRLHVRNIDLKNRKIIIYPEQSKTHRQDQVEIPDAFMQLIRTMKLEKYQQHDFLFGRELRTGPESLGRNRITQLHHDVLKKLNFSKDFTLYSWKHTGVVNAFRKEKIDVYSIMRQLRHTSLDHTQVYLKSLGLESNKEFASKMK